MPRGLRRFQLRRRRGLQHLSRRLWARRVPFLDEPVALVPIVGDAEDPAADLQLYVDQDYDGTFELGPLPAAEAVDLTYATSAVRHTKVRVVDTGGLTAEVLVPVTVITEPTCSGSLCPDGGTGGDQSPKGCSCRSGDSGTGGGVVGALFLLLLLGRRRCRCPPMTKNTTL